MAETFPKPQARHHESIESRKRFGDRCGEDLGRNSQGRARAGAQGAASLTGVDAKASNGNPRRTIQRGVRASFRNPAWPSRKRRLRPPAWTLRPLRAASTAGIVSGK